MARTKKVKPNGYRYEEWLEWAYSLYAVKKEGRSYYLISNARDWKVDRLRKRGPFVSKANASKKQLQLVRYKIKDRARGCGDMTLDLENKYGK